MRFGKTLLRAACMASLFAAPAASAQTIERVSIVVFGPPSLGAFLPPVIKEHKLDEKNGLDIAFAERPPDAYATQFNSGEFQIGGSAALLTVGLAETRGVDVTYLFNLFDFWGAVVTSRPEVKTLKDLEGREIAAARGTTNFRMFEWFAGQLGADVAKMSVVNTAPPGLVGYAVADRAAGIELWEPAYTVLLAKKPDIRTLDLAINKSWQAFAGSRNIPYLGVAAHTKWVAEHKDAVEKLYRAYRQAADWTAANPDAAAKLISAKGSDDDRNAIADLIRANDRLGMNPQPASAIVKEIEAVFKVGAATGLLPRVPGASTIYSGLLQ